MKQVQLSTFREVKEGLLAGDIYVDLTIYGIPSVLIQEFMQKVVRPYYSRGMSEAIKDMMWKAVQNEKYAEKT